MPTGDNDCIKRPWKKMKNKRANKQVHREHFKNLRSKSKEIG
jgi:hypothetical protein